MMLEYRAEAACAAATTNWLAQMLGLTIKPRADWVTTLGSTQTQTPHLEKSWNLFQAKHLCNRGLSKLLKNYAREAK